MDFTEEREAHSTRLARAAREGNESNEVDRDTSAGQPLDGLGALSMSKRQSPNRRETGLQGRSERKR